MISCDKVMTIAQADLGRRIGHLRSDQEDELLGALVHAFGLPGSDPATGRWFGPVLAERLGSMRGWTAADQPQAAA